MKRKLYSFLFLLGFIVVEGCTTLDEEILDETSTTLSNKQAADAALAPVYGRMYDLFNHTNYFSLQEISTDEAILPYRGGTDWGDNGIYMDSHRHMFQTTDPNIRNTWTFINQGIARATIAINELPSVDDAIVPLYVAEARGMRAYYSLLSLDMFGLVCKKEDPNALSVVIRGEEAIEYIKSELLAVESALSTTVGPGRLTKGAVWGLLARLHLNSAVYRDRFAEAFTFTASDMDKVIEYCDKIISSGQYQLSADYWAIFGNDNHTNKELIFALDQRFDIPGSHNRMSYFSISGDQFPLHDFPAANGTDGPAITSDFYQSWVDAYGGDPEGLDPRFHQKNVDPDVTCIAGAAFKLDRGILRGQQYGFTKTNGAFDKCGDGTFKVSPLFYVTRSKPTLPVDFSLQVDFTVAGSNYNSGYRVEKYEFSRKSDSGRNKGEADISFIRLADIYLMRAEAKLRKNNDEASALDDVNFVRAARTATTPAPALTEMNLDLLFRERGFEFYWEMLRRTDMIRFGKYEGTWTEKTNADKSKRIFPIPQTAIDAASNIPGFLVQNPGY
jgi:hypothetical protein